MCIYIYIYTYIIEAPSGCTGSTHRSLPPLALGEVAVESFAAPQV